MFMVNGNVSGHIHPGQYLQEKNVSKKVNRIVDENIYFFNNKKYKMKALKTVVKDYHVQTMVC